MISASDFLDEAAKHGYQDYVGVPCSILAPLINAAMATGRYIAATNEGEAVAIAAGMQAAGRKPIVMMQNSGLGNALDPLTSLVDTFQIPMLLIISLRTDEPQHKVMGYASLPILTVIGVAQVQSAFSSKTDLVCSLRWAAKHPLAFALMLDPNSLSECAEVTAKPPTPFITRLKASGSFECGTRMPGLEAISIIRGKAGDRPIIATTGWTSRQLFTLGDRDNQFYMLGSMGCAASFGLGITRSKPEQTVVVLDGDGAALMHMGTLATIGTYQPNLLHIVLDNESYDSTGGQFSVSPNVDFAAIAAAVGYRRAHRCDTVSALSEVVGNLLDGDFPWSGKGPFLLHIKIAKCKVGADLRRPTISPPEVMKRFREYLCQ